MSAVARPTFVVVASLLANRATANSDDDDDESNEHLSYSVWIACGLFVILFLLFDLLRTRMWWVYEPRLHHDSYRARTPHAPGRSKWFRVAWLQKVFAYWSDEDFLLYAGVDLCGNQISGAPLPKLRAHAAVRVTAQARSDA